MTRKDVSWAKKYAGLCLKFRGAGSPRPTFLDETTTSRPMKVEPHPAEINILSIDFSPSILTSSDPRSPRSPQNPGQHAILSNPELSSRSDPPSSRCQPVHTVSHEDFEDLGQVWTYNCGRGWYAIGEREGNKITRGRPSIRSVTPTPSTKSC